MLLVPRRMERTLCSLLGGVGVIAMGDGLEASTKCSSLLTCCCLTSKRDCSEGTEREKRGQRKFTRPRGSPLDKGSINK